MEYESTFNFLTNRKYHHSDKGCHIEMIREEIKDFNSHIYIAIKKYCKTHDKMCSKTGWEDGWYNGTDSRILPSFSEKIKVCIKCKKRFRVRKNHKTKICLNCL